MRMLEACYFINPSPILHLLLTLPTLILYVVACILEAAPYPILYNSACSSLKCCKSMLHGSRLPRLPLNISL